jgi:WD40 repeat protein
VLTGSDSRLVRLLDAATGRLIHKLQGHAMPVQCVAFTPNGRLGLSGGNDRVIRVWDLAAGRLLRRLEGHTHVVTGLLPLADGRLLSCCADNTTRLWDVATGTQLAAREYTLWPSWPFEWDGRLLVACRDDAGRLRLLDVETGEEMCRFSGHRDGVWAMSLTPDGKRAVSADRGGVVVVWELPTARAG